MIDLVYFSPTGTTRKVLHAIARGIGVDIGQEVNLTRPETRNGFQAIPLHGDLLLLGLPAYEHHLPQLVIPALRRLAGVGQPAAVVALHGNAGYGAVLREEAAYLNAGGFHVIAGAAFVGEHSFSNHDLPIAVGRPDVKDLDLAYQYGAGLRKKMDEKEHLPSIHFPSKIPIPLRFLPRESVRMVAHPPDITGDCNQCSACIKVCPVSAIDPETLQIDQRRCVRCYACVRACRRNARMIRVVSLKAARFMMRKAIRGRMEPEFFW